MGDRGEVIHVRVYVTRKVPADCLGELAPFTVDGWASEDVAVPQDILAQVVRGCDGLLCMLSERITPDLLDNAPHLKIIANCAVGYDNIDVAACTARSIAVTNTPGVLTEATADLTFGLLIAAARRITEGERLLRAGDWKSWSIMFLAGSDVHGATLGIIGLGRIGAAVARRGLGFGMRILYVGNNVCPEQIGIQAERTGIDELLRRSDFVSVHVPLSDQTRGLIGARELGLMKNTAILINTARGPIIDETALIQALHDRRIGGAALDVMETEPIGPGHPLLDVPNLVLTPHIGSASVPTRRAMVALAARNLARGLAGEMPPALVNPQVWPRCLDR